MTDLTTFDFHGNPVRTAGTFEAPLFCAAGFVILVAISGTCLLLGVAGIFVWAADRIATALTTDCTCQE